jgi:hypothetical protein
MRQKSYLPQAARSVSQVLPVAPSSSAAKTMITIRRIKNGSRSIAVNRNVVR